MRPQRTLRRLLFAAAAFALVGLGGAVPAEAQRLKKTFESAAAGGNRFDRGTLGFYAPPRLDGGPGPVIATLTLEDRCTPWPSRAFVPPRIAAVRLAPAGPSHDDSAFFDDFFPCAPASTTRPPWSLTDGAQVAFYEDNLSNVGGECVLRLARPTQPAPATCGNGVPNAGEGCDDGNDVDGDGCSRDCLIENLRSRARIEFPLVPGEAYALELVFFSPEIFDDGLLALLGGESHCFAVELCLPVRELCGNGVDEDCDGAVDEAGCAPDSDGDGFADAQDCLPANPLAFPGGYELCDGVDNDCDGIADDNPDGDGRAEACDICPAHFDPAQTDSDRDGIGDACDPCLGDPLNACFGPVARAVSGLPVRIDAGGFGVDRTCRSASDTWYRHDLWGSSFAFGETLVFDGPFDATPVFGCTDFDTEALLLEGLQGTLAAPHMKFLADLIDAPAAPACERLPRPHLANLVFVGDQIGGARTFDVAVNGRVPPQLRGFNPFVAAGGAGPVARSVPLTLEFHESLALEFRPTVGYSDVEAVEVLQGPAPPPAWSAFVDADGDGLGTPSGVCIEPPQVPWLGWVSNDDDCDDTSPLCGPDCADLDGDGLRACEGDCDDADAACGVCPGEPLFADDVENAAASAALWTRVAFGHDPAAAPAWSVTDVDAASGLRSWVVGNVEGLTVSDASLITPPIDVPAGAFLRFAHRYHEDDALCAGEFALEYEDGATWRDAAPWIVRGREFLGAPSAAWHTLDVSLAELAGSTTRLRWRFSQAQDALVGWHDNCEFGAVNRYYVDDVEIVRGTFSYADADGDGFGDPATALRACSPPAGRVDNGADCDDTDPLVPDAGGVAFERAFGSFGATLGLFDQPRSVAVGAARVYVADRNTDRVQVFDRQGQPLFQFGSSGSGPGQFLKPFGIDVDASGRIWVVDQDNDRIQVFNAAGAFQFQFGSFGSANGQFNDPLDVDVDGTGLVYVMDRFNHRVQVFNESGVYQRKWGSQGTGNGQFFQPGAIYADGQGKVFVADTDNHRIQVFDAVGNFLFKFGSNGGANGQLVRPLGIETNAAGQIWVADFGNHRVQVFDAAGNFEFAFGGLGSAAGQFDNLLGLALDETRRVWVTDFNNHRIQAFRVAARDADGDGAIACTDCDDSDAALEHAPGEIEGLEFANRQTLQWSPPADPGATAVLYDVLRSAAAGDFGDPAATCQTTGTALTMATDSAAPARGVTWFYLIRATNDCPDGDGSLGYRTGGIPRSGRSCGGI